MRLGAVVAACVVAVGLSAGAAQAKDQTVVLNVDNATCALCGPIVKGTLERVPGVKSVAIKEADAFSGAVVTVGFDDATTSVKSLIDATTNAGYPSHPAE